MKNMSAQTRTLILCFSFQQPHPAQFTLRVFFKHGRITDGHSRMAYPISAHFFKNYRSHLRITQSQSPFRSQPHTHSAARALPAAATLHLIQSTNIFYFGGKTGGFKMKHTMTVKQRMIFGIFFYFVIHTEFPTAFVHVAQCTAKVSLGMSSTAC